MWIIYFRDLYSRYSHSQQVEHFATCLIPKFIQINCFLLQSPVFVTLAPPPDFIVDQLSISPQTAHNGGTFTVTYEVINEGFGTPFETAPWTDVLVSGLYRCLWSVQWKLWALFEMHLDRCFGKWSVKWSVYGIRESVEITPWTDALVNHQCCNQLEALTERRPPWPRQIITPTLHTVKTNKEWNGTSMKTTRGKVGNLRADVLRDSGCNSVCVDRKFVSDNQLTGEHKVCKLIDVQTDRRTITYFIYLY